MNEGTKVEELFRLGGPFFLIAGPCVLEDDALNLRIGEALARMSDDLGLPIVFKASFDKANRSSPGSPRGPGVDEGLRKLERDLAGATPAAQPSAPSAAAEPEQAPAAEQAPGRAAGVSA